MVCPRFALGLTALALMLGDGPVVSVAWGRDLPGHKVASSKIENALLRPLAASEAQFVEAALKAPAKGSCEVLSPDPGFVEEMLLDVSSIGAPSGRKYERRVALVVGNGAYQSVGPLTNPPNDAASIAKMFRALGFTIYSAIDATDKSLDECFTKFKGDLETPDAKGDKADIALFFYAGHGVQLTSQADNEKRNYMLSVDASVDPESGKAKGFQQVDRVLTEMRAHSKQAVFLYDACRNAPYGEGLVKEADGAAVRQYDASGAAQVDAEEGDRASAAGLFIAYATSPGKTADDAWGPQGSPHSPFTEALLKNLPQAGLLLEEALAKSYYAVGQLTGGKQTPWTSSSLQTPVLLNGATRRADVQIKSAAFAARSARAREKGTKWQALMSALEGQPPKWTVGESAKSFAAARAELYRAREMRDLAFVGHRDAITAFAISADGKRLATASQDKTAKIWDTGTGALLHTLLHADQVLSIAFSPDSRIVATGAGAEDSSVKIWKVESGAMLHALKGHTDNVLALAFSPDGSRLATASDDNTARLWETTTGALVRVLDHADRVHAVAFSNDGKRLATASAPASVWDARTGALVRSIPTYTRIIAFSPDGASLATASFEEPTAILWNIKTGDALDTFRHDAGVTAVAFSRDGMRLATASNDHKAKIWNAKTGSLFTTLDGHADSVRAIAFSPDGRQVATLSDDSTARLWDADAGTVLKTFEATGIDDSIMFTPDGAKLTAISDFETATLHDAYDGAVVRTLPGPRDSFTTAISFSPDGEIIATGSSVVQTAMLWSEKTGALLRTIDGHQSGVFAVAFRPDGERLATGSDAVRLWNPRTGALLKTLESSGDDPISSIAFSPDGTRLATDAGSAAILWDAETGKRLMSFQGHDGKVFSVGFSPNGELIATASSDETAKIWNAASGELLLSLKGSDEFVSDVAFSPDGLRLATASYDKTAQVWNTHTGDLIAAFAGHQGTLNTLAFNAEGTVLATASSDKAIKLWDVETATLLTTLEGHGASVVDVVFKPDGKRLASASFDGTAKVWDAGLYGPELLEAAYALLTDEQRAEVERERIRYWEVAPELLQ